MKKLLVTTLMLTSFLFYQETKAQFRLNLNFNRGNRPDWGLAVNSPGNYYYLPEIECYYDLMNNQFIYADRGNWVFANSLPYAYRNYNPYNGYKVMVNEYRPYLHNDYYRNRYGARPNVYNRQPIFDERREGRFYGNENRFNGPRYGDRDRDERRSEYGGGRNDRDRDDRNQRGGRGRG